MIGLMLIATAVVWVSASVWLSNAVGNMVAKPLWRRTAKLAILLVLVSSPFMDEIIGKYQFETLCKSNGIEHTDLSKARGKAVRVEYVGRKVLTGTILPIQEVDVLFRDQDSGNVLIRNRNYYAEGGWLTRYTWISMGSSGPMLFPGNGCGLGAQDRLFRSAQISVLN